MRVLTPKQLEQLGRDAAQGVTAAVSIEQIEVTTDEDSLDRPVYTFSFLVDSAKAKRSLGHFRLRLAQRLRDELSARGDMHYPVVRLLDRSDWGKRLRA